MTTRSEVLAEQAAQAQLPTSEPEPLEPVETDSSEDPKEIEKELDYVKAQIAEMDERLKTLVGPEREPVLDALDELIDRLHELAEQLPFQEADEPAEPDNVVQLFGSTMSNGARPSVVFTPLVHQMVDDAVEAFNVFNTPPTIFQRAGRLARFVPDPLSGEPVLTDFLPATFTAQLSSLAQFCKRGTDEQNQPTLVPIMPPSIVVKALMESPPPSAPAIKRISQCPYLRAANGYIVREKGYQSLERIYVAEDFTKSISVPDAPTEEQVEAARKLLCDDLLGDFPFAHPSDRAHAISMLLEPFVAELVAGPNPLHLLEASVIDSGKTHLGDVCSALARGRTNSWLNFAGEKEEQTKTLAAALLKLPPIVAIDNVKVALDLPLLEAALTGSVEVRILGRSEMSPTLDTRGTIFMATVNNATLSDDLLRRSVRSRLEPSTERPGDRTFKHPDLIEWVLEHRAEIITALLTLARNWMVKTWAGAPSWSGRRLSSFKRWSEVMGGILSAAGIEGFLDDLAIREEMKSEATSEWHALVAAWRERFQHGHVTAREILDELVAPPVTRYTKDSATYTVPAEAVALLPDSMGATKIEARAKKLGQLLRGRRGNIFDGWKIRFAHDDVQNQNVYWLEQVSVCPATPAPPPSDAANVTAADA